MGSSLSLDYSTWGERLSSNSDIVVTIALAAVGLACVLPVGIMVIKSLVRKFFGGELPGFWE